MPKAPPVLAIDHIHAPQVSVREHMLVIRERLRRHGAATFRSLIADCQTTLEVVARFLGVLELYRDGVVAFDQAAALSSWGALGRWARGRRRGDRRGRGRGVRVSGAGLQDGDGGQLDDASSAHDPIDDDSPAVAIDDAESTAAAADEPETAAAADSSETPGRPELADPSTLRAAIEAVLFVVEAPITPAALASALQRPEVEVEAGGSRPGRRAAREGSGIELREIAGGVRLYTRSDLAAWIEAFLLDGQRARLTQAALETLAVIAYRQPVTRARISAIRGVNVDGVVRTLTTRGLITEVGADPDTGGGLYRTTELFLEKMGLNSLDELPSLAPLLPELNGAESDEL